jgi:hypothetical protein
MAINDEKIDEKEPKQLRKVILACFAILAVAVLVFGLHLNKDRGSSDSKRGSFANVASTEKASASRVNPRPLDDSISGPLPLAYQLQQAISGRSIRDVDQALFALLNDQKLSKREKFKLLWDAYSLFKNSADKTERDLAIALLDAVSSLDTALIVGPLVNELAHPATPSEARKSLVNQLVYKYELSDNEATKLNNAAILAAVKASTGDQDIKVAASAVLGFAAIGPPSETIPILNAVITDGKVLPWEYSVRLADQLFNITDPAIQVETLRLLTDFAIRHATDRDVQDRFVPTFIGIVQQLGERQRLSPESNAVLSPYLSRLNPLPLVGTPSFISANELTLENVRSYPMWFEASALLSGQSMEQAMTALSLDQKRLAASPETAAALLLSPKGADFMLQIRQSGNSQLLAGALFRRANAVPQPNNVSDELRRLAAQLSAT